MYVSEQFNMYHLAYQLVIQDKFNILYMDFNVNELWLNKSEQKGSTVIRIIQRGFDWKNHLKMDISSVFQRVEKMKHFLTGKQIRIYNVYITEYSPIDDWEALKKPLQIKEKKDVQMKVFYLSESNFTEEYARLLKQINSTLDPILELPPELEQNKWIQEYKDRLSKIFTEKREKVKSVIQFGTPRLTYLFILINIFVFMLLELNGGSTNIDTLIQYGAKYNYAILEGEWWRIISSMFLHIGIIHLMLNMVALYYLGITVERTFGSIRFFIIYFISGIGGGLASFAFNEHVAAGASGALFGLFGALLFFTIIYKQLFFQTMGKNLILILIINITFGIVVPQIDMGAHIGGLVIGFLTSLALYVPTKRNILLQCLSLFVLIALLLFLIIYGVHTNLVHIWT